MSDATGPLKQSIPNEMITKLVKAGYLQPAQCDDADAITTAIVQMRRDLRGGAVDDDGLKSPTALIQRNTSYDG